MSAVRLDVELVRRRLARARGQADELVRAGRVAVDGRRATKAAQKVDEGTRLEVAPGERPDYVGRGALKLAGLLEDLEGPDDVEGPEGTDDLEGPEGREDLENPGVASPRIAGPRVAGRRCLDAGASTGGFTQVLLQHGAREVVAVDVGHDQLAQALRADDRVVDRSGTSVRGLSPSDVGGQVELLVADLSFISLSVVLPDLVALVAPDGDLLLMVKPQFEVGRRRVGSGGVVRDPGLRAEAVESVARSALERGLVVRAVRASRWPGPSGNVEYFLWLTLPTATTPAGGTVSPDGLAAAVRTAVEEGPS